MPPPATSEPLAIPNTQQTQSSMSTSPSSSPTRRPSVPMDTSKLNNTPAPLPEAPLSTSPTSTSGSLFSNPNPFGVTADAHSAPTDSAYLDAANHEAPQHPTVAETGTFSFPAGTAPIGVHHDPGPMTGQLQRRESDAKRRIIRLASFGGEGLRIKPPIDLHDDDESAVVDDKV